MLGPRKRSVLLDGRLQLRVCFALPPKAAACATMSTFDSCTACVWNRHRDPLLYMEGERKLIEGSNMDGEDGLSDSAGMSAALLFLAVPAAVCGAIYITCAKASEQ